MVNMSKINKLGKSLEGPQIAYGSCSYAAQLQKKILQKKPPPKPQQPIPTSFRFSLAAV